MRMRRHALGTSIGQLHSQVHQMQQGSGMLGVGSTAMAGQLPSPLNANAHHEVDQNPPALQHLPHTILTVPGLLSHAAANIPSVPASHGQKGAHARQHLADTAGPGSVALPPATGVQSYQVVRQPLPIVGKSLPRKLKRQAARAALWRQANHPPAAVLNGGIQKLTTAGILCSTEHIMHSCAGSGILSHMFPQLCGLPCTTCLYSDAFWP